LNYDPKRKRNLLPESVQCSNPRKKKTLWRLWHSLVPKSSFHRAKGTEISSNNVRLRGHSNKTTTTATTNNGGLTIQATTPTGTTKRAVSVEEWDTVKRNADSE
jgi:hypothetical protein